MKLPHSPRKPAVGRGARFGGALGGLLAAALLSFGGSGTAQAANSGTSLIDPWIRMIIPARPAAGYFTLNNPTDKTIALTGASSPECGALMLHKSTSAGGQDKMEMVKSVPVPAHGEVKFAPGGYHLMCMKPASTIKPGTAIQVTLTFQDGKTVQADFPVYGATGKPAK